MANMFGNNNNNTLSGTANPDNLFGRGGNDQLFGLSGNDRLNGGVGNDLLNGGLGIDTADYSNGSVAGQSFIGATAGVTVNLNLMGAQNTGGAGLDRLVSIENLTGTPFNDTLTGNAANNVLQGLAGNDMLKGGNGNDRLNGGAGIDTASYATATSGVAVSLDINIDNVVEGQGNGGGGSDTLVSIENLTGSKFNDELRGVGAQFTLNGEAGNDVLLLGLADNSTLNGGAGNDELLVRDSSAVLNGGDGNDILSSTSRGVVHTYHSTMNGGAGADILWDDPEVDDETTFAYHLISDSPTGAGRDKINGFEGNGVEKEDRIDLRDIDANALVAGNQAFTYIGSAAFTAAGQLRYSGGILSGSTDADTAAEIEIQLIGAPKLFVNPASAGTDILL